MGSTPASIAVGAPVATPDNNSTSDPFGEHTPMMVVLDTSGSMNDEIDSVLGNGGRRIDSAQAALLDLVAALGAGQPYGMIAYPGRDAPTVDGCSTGRIETPLADLDPAQASAQIRRMTPDGDTPTGPALLRASQAITDRYGEDSIGVIVLVSDGESNCGTPPCEVAGDIRAAGIDVQVNTVGLQIDGPGEDELRCIADATGGRYVGVDDGDELIDAITGAALARTSVSVSGSESFSVVSGTGAAPGGTMQVTVRSSGRVPAADVRVSLSLALDDETAGSVLVTRPVRFLGNLGVGDERVVSFDVRPDDSLLGPATWNVSVTARNARPQLLHGKSTISDTLGQSALGALFDGVTRVAVVGDSYSSGEGAGSYIEGTDGGDGSKCHRSDTTYAAEIWTMKNVDLIACSGAVTSDFFNSQHSGDADVPPQLTVLRASALSKAPPQAVLLSIGGNDAGFADIATACIFGPVSCDNGIQLDWKGLKDNRTAAIERALAVQPDVADVLRAVDSAVNDASARRNRGGKVAPIVLIPYPRILPETSSGQEAPGGCFVGISAEEVAFLNDFFDALNTSVQLAAYTVRNEGHPVYVVPDVVDAFQPDHTICEGGSQSYAVFDNWDKVSTLHISALLGKSGLLHPNRDGHAAMARAISAWSKSRAARKVTSNAVPTWNPDLVGNEVPWIETVATNLLVPDHAAASAGGSVTVRRSGLSPGSQAVVRLDSSPTVLGTAVADEFGGVAETFRIPADVPVGEHHVVVFGFETDGEPVAVAQEMRIVPPGEIWLWPLVAVGIMLLLLSTGALLLARKRA